MLRIKSGQPMPTHEIIPTPSFGLNYVMGGGLWTGRFSILWGNPSSGKTTFALHTLAKAQEMGFTPVIIDAEGSYTDSWAEKCGLDINNREYIRSTIVEEIQKEIVPMMQDANKKYLFLLDSINAIVVENFYKTAEGGNAIGLTARSQTFMFQKLASYMHPGNGVICIAQQTVQFSGQHAYMGAKIGNAANHWATNIVHLSATRAKDNLQRGDNDLIVDRNVNWTIDKSKQRPIEGITGNYWFSPQEAYIDTKREAVEIAVANGVIHKNGPAWFLYNDQKFNGINKLLAGLDEHDVADILKQLQDMELVFAVEKEDA